MTETRRTRTTTRLPRMLGAAALLTVVSLTGTTIVGARVLGGGQTQSTPFPGAPPSESTATAPPSTPDEGPRVEPPTAVTEVAEHAERPDRPSRQRRQARPTTPSTRVRPTPLPPAHSHPDVLGRCERSLDPACGPVRFVPKPQPDTPASISWALEPERPVAGEPFDLVIRWSDAQASHRMGIAYCMPESNPNPSGAGPTVVGLCADGWSPPPCEAYGTWTPPAVRPGADEERFTKTLPAGSYGFDFGISLGSVEPDASDCRPDPYQDHVFVKDTFTVAAPA